MAVLISLASAATASAGNVQASIQGGSLYIYGDDNASSIVVDSPLPNRIRIRGRNIEGQTTTVNSRTTPVVLGDWTGGVFIYLYGGTDSVSLQNLNVNGTVHVDLGTGDDDLTVGRILAPAVPADEQTTSAVLDSPFKVEGALVVIGSDGNDYAQIDNASIEGRITIDLGAGADEAYLTFVNGGNTLAIYPGSGPDIVDVFATDLALDLIVDDPAGKLTADLANVNTGRNAFIYGTSAADIVRGVNVRIETLFQIFTEGANDFISLSGQSRTLEIFAGAGFDRTTLTSMTAGTVRVFQDAGVDTLTIEDSDLGLLNAYGGADNDTFNLRATVVDTANIYGDGGTDTFRRNGGNVGDLNLFSIENQ